MCLNDILSMSKLSWRILQLILEMIIRMLVILHYFIWLKKINIAILDYEFTSWFDTCLLYCRDNKELVKQLSTPLPHSKDLNFPTRFPQKGWEQFKACLWKQYLSYWRSPSYNLVRVIVMLISSIALAALFWKHGKTM